MRMKTVLPSLRIAVTILAIALCALLAWSTPVHAQALPEGSPLFEAHCAGCHPGGGNIIRRGKTLKQKALTQNGYDRPETLTEIITHGKGNLMSAFGDKLTPEEIQAVVTYVLAEAAQDWH
jgi:cytochrome c6